MLLGRYWGPAFVSNRDAGRRPGCRGGGRQALRLLSSAPLNIRFARRRITGMRAKPIILVALLVAMLGLAGCLDVPGAYGPYGYNSGYGYGGYYPSGYGYYPSYGYGGDRYGDRWQYHRWDHDGDHDGWGHGHWNSLAPYGVSGGAFHNGGFMPTHANGFHGGFGGSPRPIGGLGEGYHGGFHGGGFGGHGGGGHR
jgi:hypothetical protein